MPLPCLLSYSFRWSSGNWFHQLLYSTAGDTAVVIVYMYVSVVSELMSGRGLMKAEIDAGLSYFSREGFFSYLSESSPGSAEQGSSRQSPRRLFPLSILFSFTTFFSLFPLPNPDIFPPLPLAPFLPLYILCLPLSKSS